MQKEINDFGNKIGGAKKEFWINRTNLDEADLENMNIDEINKTLTKDALWPKMDYLALYKEGVDRHILFFKKRIRDSLPNFRATHLNCNANDIQLYIQFITEIKNACDALITETDCKELYNKVFTKEFVNKYYYSLLDYKIMAAFRFISNDVIYKQMINKKFLVTYSEIAYYYSTIITIPSNDKFTVTESETIPNMNRIFITTKDFYGTVRVDKKYEIKPGNFIAIYNNSGYGVGKELGVFKTFEEAKEAIYKKANEDNNTKLEKPKAKRKSKFKMPIIESFELENRKIPETNEKEFMDTFKPYGIEFGNYLNNSERQLSLNCCYQALKDLANILNIKESNIMFNGQLSIAFGARGASAAAAHYEPLKKVINLTKMNGAGSLAHEWAHALDNALAMYLGFSTFGYNAYASEHYNHSSDVSKLINEMFNYIKKQKLSNKGFLLESQKMDGQYSKCGNGYWSSYPEMFARAFACYVTDKCKEKGIYNPYLSGHSDICSAIPKDDERKMINQYFDKLFDLLRKQCYSLFN